MERLRQTEVMRIQIPSWLLTMPDEWWDAYFEVAFECVIYPRWVKD